MEYISRIFTTFIILAGVTYLIAAGIAIGGFSATPFGLFILNIFYTLEWITPIHLGAADNPIGIPIVYSNTVISPMNILILLLFAIVITTSVSIFTNAFAKWNSSINEDAVKEQKGTSHDQNA